MKNTDRDVECLAQASVELDARLSAAFDNRQIQRVEIELGPAREGESRGEIRATFHEQDGIGE